MKTKVLRVILLVVICFFIITTCRKDEKITDLEITEVKVVDNSVKISGTIISLSGNKNSEYGVAYSIINSSPVITDTVARLGLPQVGPFTTEIKNLKRNKTYYVRGFIKEGDSYLYADVRTAVIAAIEPVATTMPETSLEETSATLNGSVNPNGSTTLVSFEYGPTSAYGSTADAVTNIISGTSATAVSANITGLTPNTTYHYRVKAVNAAGTALGADSTFKTHANVVPPVVTSSAATSVNNTTATLNGSVNPNGSTATVSFEYGTTILAYESTANATPATVSGIIPTNVSTALTGLVPGQLYHYRVKAVSAGGTEYSEDMTFTTTQPPSATTQEATGLTQTTATLNGVVNANGSATTITFEYGATTSYGSTINGVPDNATGTSITASKADITGLTENTTYHFRIKAVSSAGTIYGDDLFFTTSPVGNVVPTVSTKVVTSITQTTAASGGYITSDGGDVLTGSGVCWSTSPAPTVADSKTSDGTTTGSYISNLTGLTAGTIYYVRAYATNAQGTGYGEEKSFTTSALAVVPSVTTIEITDLTTTTATSGGNIISDGGAAVTASGVCWSLNANPTVNNFTTTDGTNSGAYISSVTGLNAITTYYLRAYATNSAGTGYGEEFSFNTLDITYAPPTATSSAATAITNTTATLNGSVNANGSSTTVSFEYGLSFLYGSTVNATPGTFSGLTPTTVNAGVTGLVPGQLYHFRVKAVGAGGTVFGDDLTFTTPQPPTATTQTATNLTQTSATLNGLVNAHDLATTISFEYGTTTAYGTTVAGVPVDATGSVNTNSLADISGLSPNTTYHFRIVAVSSAGITNGNDLTFATEAIAAELATLTTADITAITETTAASGGDITSDGGGLITDRGVCWSTSADPTTADSKTSNGTGTGTFTSNLTSLTPGTTYYVRAYAINSAGPAYGNNVTFVTSLVLGPVATTAAATDITQTTALLNGSVNANDLTATVTFEYGLTESYGSTITADQSPVTGSSNTAVSAGITSLTKNTLYNYRVKVLSSTGITYGQNQTFNTLAGVLPTVTTASISGINSSGALSGGDVTSEGSEAVTERGVCWSETINPTIISSRTADGLGSGSYSSTISGLSSSTMYHVRAYATSSEGTSYGEDLTFTTNSAVAIPTLSTTAITDLGQTTASSGGTITNDGGATVSSRGVCWSTSANPTTANSKTIDGSGTGSFSSGLTGLLANTTYHVRAYAINSAGPAYGNDIQFTTNAAPVVPSISTSAITSVTTTTAVSGGNITFDGGAAVTDRGVCWSTSPNPTTANSKTSNGSGTGSFVSNLTSLSPNTTYYVRAYAINSVGPGYGNQLSFTTPCIAPTSSTSAASSVAATSATLNGSVNANTFATTVTFEYGLTTGYGTSVSATQSPVTGGASTPVSIGISGLSPNTVYHFRVKSVSCGGTRYGNDLTFTTLCTPATATSVAATPVGSTSATIKGTVNANGITTTVTFEYGLTASYGSTIAATPGTATGSGTTSVAASLTGLTPNTLYHYRVKAVSCGGTVYGNDLTLNTLCAAPTATTLTASSVSSSSASLSGTVNANYSSTTVTFQYGTTTSYGSTVTATQSPVTGSAGTFVNKVITGLAANTLYHFRVVTVNCGGTVYGSDQSFTTLCVAPAASTSSATSLSTSGATLNGTVNANNFSTTVTFEYGTTTGYGSTATATQSPVTGSASTAVNKAITGLAPGTLYHFRVKTVNCGGTVYGSDQTFTTPCLTPTASTTAASGITSSSATINGTVNANGFSTTVYFQYGLTTSYGSTVTAAQSPVAGSIATAVSQSITGLSPNTVYHYRLRTVNCGGTVYGNDMTFTTLCIKATATTNGAPAYASTSATLMGSVVASGYATTVSFMYGTGPKLLSYTVAANPSSVTGSALTNVYATISGLSPSTTYYYRVKAVNCGGTSYGSVLSFTTPARLTDVVGNTYNVVTISGSGTWMQESLRTSKYEDGTSLVLNSDSAYTPTYYYHYYNNSVSNGNTYGYMYNGYSLGQPKDVCPTGWHVPTITEWSTLVSSVGSTSTAGGQLKQTGTTYWTSPNTGANNLSLFTALGGGYYFTSYADLKNAVCFWSKDNLRYVRINYNSASISGTSTVLNGTYESALYIRCKKD